MHDLTLVGPYFQRKAGEWTSADGSVAAHIRRRGRDGLIAEFRADPDFDVVFRYLHRIQDVQYVHDASYAEFRAQVRSILGDRRQAETIVRAALLASGISPFADRLVRIAGALPPGRSR
jgi:hypothetical protein